MGAFSIWHWIIVLVIVVVLFGGRGKISSLMGDFGKGLKSFKKAMKEEDTPSSGAHRDSIDEKPSKTAEMADTAENKEKS